MRRTAMLLLGITLLAACDQPAATTTPASRKEFTGTAAASRADAQEHKDVAALRAATAQFHRIEVAAAAGWNEQAPPGCFSSPDGAMGYHFRNLSKVGTLDPTQPQFVMYEPQKDGSMKLVGAEFIYPGLPTDTPPVLFGQPFSYNYTFNVWALHVWAWRENPSGLYANWNPKVSCEFAATQTAMSH